MSQGMPEPRSVWVPKEINGILVQAAWVLPQYAWHIQCGLQSLIYTICRGPLSGLVRTHSTVLAAGDSEGATIKLTPSFETTKMYLQDE